MLEEIDIPKRENEKNDIVFISSGISFLKLLKRYKNNKTPLKISIIQKGKEFHTGMVNRQQKLVTDEEFYINGPLLGGNLINHKPIWYVEHGERISVLSEALAEILHKKLAHNMHPHEENLVKAY